MKQKLLKQTVIGSLLLCGLNAHAETDEVPCVVFSGRSTEECRLSLSTHNRIYFGENGMTIRSSVPGEKDVELSYSLFNRLAFRDAVPTGIDEAEDAVEKTARLVFHRADKCICIEAASEGPFAVGIFDLTGRQRLVGRLKPGEDLDLHTLSAGVYIATATCGETKLNLKLIIK